MLKIAQQIFLTSFFFLSFNAYSWGPKGQEITVLIAESYLTLKATADIKSILGPNITLSSFAVWADQARNTTEWNYTGGWHYIDVADSGTYGHEATQLPDDVLEAINYCVDKLKSNITSTEKTTWLKFLVHFVGDVHRPMHVGRPGDRGGNSTQVSYGKTMNLHYLWDTAFISKNSLSPAAYANALKSQNRSQIELTRPFSTDVVIKEDLALRPFMYSYKNGVIDGNYEKQAFQIVDERLWTGGLRLASLLNSIFR